MARKRGQGQPDNGGATPSTTPVEKPIGMAARGAAVLDAESRGGGSAHDQIADDAAGGDGAGAGDGDDDDSHLALGDDDLNLDAALDGGEGGDGQEQFADDDQGGDQGDRGGAGAGGEGPTDPFLRAMHDLNYDVSGFKTGQEFLDEHAGLYNDYTLATRELEQYRNGTHPALHGRQQAQDSPAPQPKAQGGAAPAADEFKWQRPEWDPANLRHLRVVADKDGNETLTVAPGADPRIVGQYQAFQQFVSQNTEKFFADPLAFLAPIFEHLSKPKFKEVEERAINTVRQGYDQERQQQYAAQLWNQPGYVEVNAQGVPYRNRDNSLKLTAEGAKFRQDFEHYRTKMSDAEAADLAFRLNPPKPQKKAPAGGGQQREEREPTLADRTLNRGQGGRDRQTQRRSIPRREAPEGGVVGMHQRGMDYLNRRQ